jgi:Arylsulfotransferase (ASST)
MSRNASVVVIGLVCALAAAPLATSTPASAAGDQFAFATTPALSPAFSVRTTDYVVRCAGHPTTHVVTTGASVVGGRRFAGRADVQARLVPGQSLQITGAGHSYFVRCVPADFPKYSATVNGTPQTNGLLVTPAASLSVPAGHYVVAFDARGVAVWWYRDPKAPADAKFFGSSTIGWASGNEVATTGTFSLRGLNGAVKHTVGTTKMTLDEHDLQQLPGGNYLAILDVSRPGVDLSSWGRSAQSTIVDNEIVELNAANKIVWSWSAAAHINVATANLNWRNQFPDVIHMNSIQLLGNDELVFSVRHLDAVYAIDMRTGAILWKLGGTPTAQSLTVAGDQYAASNPDALFSGQHEARILPDGTLTVQDNGTQPLRPVRALRFSIDPATRTATEIAQVTDSRFGTAFCCGGVVHLPTGDWLASWGTAEYATELTPSGTPVLTVSYAPYFSYRVAPVVPAIAALRAGMNAMVAPLKL